MASSEGLEGGSRDRFLLDPRTRPDSVTLRVTDRARTAEFYEDLLGFSVLREAAEATALGTGEGIPLVHLVDLGPEGRPPRRERRAGLYHFALLFPERAHLATLLQHLRERRDRVDYQGAADHHVSESVYIQDPEGNGIELTVDRPREVWAGITLPELLPKNAPLNTRDLLALADPDGWAGLPPGTAIGHVHLYGSDVPGSQRFYAALGLDDKGEAYGMAAFAVGEYHHHVGVNNWLGTGIPPARDDAAGLDHFAFRLPDDQAFEDLHDHLEATGVPTKEEDEDRRRSLWIRDPNNVRVRLTVGSAEGARRAG